MRKIFAAMILVAALCAAADIVKMTPLETFVSGTNETLRLANGYTDAAIQSSGEVTPEMVTNIVLDVAHAPGNYAAVSNAAMNAVKPSDLAAATNATETSIDAKRDKADLSVYAWRLSEWTFSGSRVDPSKTYSINLFPEQWDGRILWTFDMREDGEPLNTYELVLQEGVEPDFVTLITPDMWMEHFGMDVTATRRRVAIPTDDRLATTSGVARAISAVATQLDAETSTNAAQTAALAAQASQLSQQSQSLSTLGSQVSAIGAHMNAEDGRFVSTNYNSETHMPEAYVEVKITEHGESRWLTIWREMTRWEWFLGIYTNDIAALSAALANKGEKEYAFYDGVTGQPAPDGFFWIAQPRVAVAAGMSYQRYVDTGGAVWVLESNGMVAEVNGTTNGFFRIADDEGNVQFEIVKGNARTVAAVPGAMAHESVMGVTHWFTTYAVTNAASAPVAMFCRDIGSPEWYAETDGDCPCNVSWTNPEAGVYVCEWWAKGTEPQMFLKAEYGQGSESRIVQTAPVEMQYIVVNGVKYALGTATISGSTVLTLSPVSP